MPSSISTGIVSDVSLSSTALSSNAQAVESDSDDDLVPYDLVESDSDDNDDATPTAGTTVAQIMHGLRDQENADRFHASLVHLPTILRDNVDDIDFDQTAAQLAAQLLRLDNRFALPTFATDRYTALVATCVKCPTAVAKYLTSQFYNENLDVQQRLLILDTLADTAQTIAGLLPNTDIDNDTNFENQLTNETKQAKLIEEIDEKKSLVNKRIEDNTRRWTVRRPRRAASATPARFRAISGLYFFELMTQFDDPAHAHRLMGSDGLVLGQLLRCLAIVLQCHGGGDVVSERMARTLCDFLLAVRYHKQVFVRRACVIACSSVVSTLFPRQLVDTPGLPSLINQCRAWLLDLIDSESDDETRELAARCMATLASQASRAVQR